MYQGDYTAASTVVFNFNTAAFSDGSPITLGGTPALSVYKNSTTESQVGVTLTVDYDSRTGMHHVAVDTSADGTFYAAGNDFDVVITTGTVGGTSVVGRKVGSFSLENRCQKADVRKVVGQTAPTPSVTGVIVTDCKYWTSKTIPTANVDGVPLVDDKYLLGTIYVTPAVAGTMDVNVKAINNVSASSVTNVRANIGTTQPINFTGTAGTAYAQVDIIDWASAAVTGMPMPTYTQPTGFLTTTFPGTVASPTNITAGTITTVTNLTNAPTAGDLTTTMKTSVQAAADAAVTANALVLEIEADTDTLTAGVTLAVGAISDASFTVPAETTTPPTGTIGKIHWLAARLGLRRVWDDVVGKVLSVFKADGTTPQSLNNYTKKDDGTRDVAAALTGLTTSADYTLLLDGSGRSTDPNAIIVCQSVAEVAAYGGFVGGGAHTIDRFDGSGAVLACGFYGDGVSAFLATVSGDPTVGFIVKVDGVVKTPSYNATNHVGEVVLAAAGSLARGPHLLEIVWTNAGAGAVFLERTANGGSNPSIRCYDAGGNAKFIPPAGYGPVAYLREVTYVRSTGGLENQSFFGWNGLADNYQGGGVHTVRGGVASPVRGKIVVPAGQTGQVWVLAYSGTVQVSRDGGLTYGTKVAVNTTVSNGCSLTKVDDYYPPGEHEVVILNDTTNGDSAGGNYIVVAVMAVNATWVQDPYPTRPQMMVYGDSLWLSWRTTAAECPARLVSQLGGWSVAVRSIGGSTVVGDGQYDAANVTGFSGPALNAVLVQYGINDDVSGGVTAFQNAYGTMIAAFVAGLPNTTVIVCQSVQPGGSFTAQRAQKNTAIQAVVTSQVNAGKTNVVYLDFEQAGFNPVTDSADGVHNNKAGAYKLAANALLGIGHADTFIPSAVGQAVTTDHGTGSYVRNTEPLDAAGTRAAVGLAAANLDAQLGEIEGETDGIAAIPTNPALSTDVTALLAAITNIQNNTFVATNVPAVLERPDAGSESVKVTVVFADETGAPHDIDASANPTVALTNEAGTSLLSRLGAWTHTSTGQYDATYTNSAGDAVDRLNWNVTATVNGKLRRWVGKTQIVDTTAVDFTSSDRTALLGVAAVAPAHAPTVNADGTTQSDLREVVGVASAATALGAVLKGVYVGTVTGAATLNSLIDSALTAADANAYNGRVVIFLTPGALSYEGATVSGFDPVLHKLTFRSNLTGIPQAGVPYVMPMMF